MKIAIYSRPLSSHTKDEVEELIRSLNNHNFEVWFNSEFANKIESITSLKIDPEHIYSSSKTLSEQIEMVFSYGGDGTFLDCVRLVYGTNIPIIGINTGRLGFLATVSPENANKLFAEIKQGLYSVEERSLLQVEGDFPEAIPHPYAFNEFTVQRQGAEMCSVKVLIDNQPLATYWGDGVILSTPSGSTAYSLSVGGPIVLPQCGCMALSPIASHNLTIRPIILPDSSVATFNIDSRDNQVYISLDNHKFTIPASASFRVKRAEKTIFLALPQNISFYDTLRNKMMWGKDGREI